MKTQSIFGHKTQTVIGRLSKSIKFLIEDDPIDDPPADPQAPPALPDSPEMVPEFPLLGTQ